MTLSLPNELLSGRYSALRPTREPKMMFASDAKWTGNTPFKYASDKQSPSSQFRMRCCTNNPF